MSDSNSNLDDIVKSYLNTQDIYKLNEYRNSILLLVSNTNGFEFVKILDEIYEKNDDPADRQRVLKLLNEVISRTENVFNFVQVVQFLLKCLKLTLCVQLSVNTMKTLLTRHFNNEDTAVYESLHEFYDILLGKKMSQYPQQCRMDFLYISNFMLESYFCGKIERQNVEMICDAVSGEKDPRNLLIMFDLLAKLAKRVAKEPKEFEYISNTYSIYYPIQFVPPKKDKIRITPAQLKKKLLGCFTSNVELAPYSIEILLDSLYSEFSVEDQHISVVSDTLYFLKKCKPHYGNQFGKFGKNLIEIIKSELLVNNDCNNDTKEDKKDNNNKKENNKEKENKILDIKEVNKIGKAYYKEWKYVDEKTKLFSEILRLFLESSDELDGNDLEVFMKALKDTLYTNYSIGYMIDVLCENSSFHSSIVDYIVLPLLEDVYKGFVDAKILEKNQNGSVNKEENNNNNIDKEENSDNTNSNQREGVLNILCMFIVPKMLVHFNCDRINEQLIVVLNKLIDTKYKISNNKIDKEENKILKLLLLSSCIVNSDLIDKQVNNIIKMLFYNKDNKNNYNKNADNNNTNNNSNNIKDVGNSRTEGNMYLEILISIYKCHPGRCLEIVDLLDSVLNYDFKELKYELDKDESLGLPRFNYGLTGFEEYIEHISYVRKDNRVTNVSFQVTEMFKVSLRRFLMEDDGLVDMKLVNKMVLLSFRCLDYIVLYRNKENNNNRTNNKEENNNKEDTNKENNETQEKETKKTKEDNTVDLCMTYASMIAMLYEFEDWSKGSEMLKSIVSSDKLLEYYCEILDYYKRSFCCYEESSFRLVFITSKLPRILSYLSRCVDVGCSGLFDCENFKENNNNNNNNKNKNIEMKICYLNLYLYDKGEMDSKNMSVDHLDDMWNNKLEDELEVVINLLNIEAYFMMKSLKYLSDKNTNNNNNPDNTSNNNNDSTNNNRDEFYSMIDFKWFNGSMLVKYVHEMYRFDFKNMIEQIKMINQYQVHNLEYDDLFFMAIPISFSEVRPILKYQIIDMRKLYKNKKKEIEENNNNNTNRDNNKDNNNNNNKDNIDKENYREEKEKENENNNKQENINKNKEENDLSPTNSREMMDESSIELREKLMRELYERLKNGSYESIPRYYSNNEIKNKSMSKVELYVSYILCLLSKGAGCLEREEIRIVMEEMNIMLNDVLSWMDSDKNNNNNTNKDRNNKKEKEKENEETQEKEENKIILSKYIRWCCDKYLLYLQTLVFGIISNLNNGKYGVAETEWIKGLLTKNMDMLIRDLVRIYEGNQVPFCRILSILCIHSIITSKFINMERSMRMRVIKNCNQFLGDPNKKVRGIAVICRHQWINSNEE